MKQTHRNRKTTRLQHWDYRNNGACFVTICTKDKQHYFGEIVHDAIQHSPIGAIADVLWFEMKHRHSIIELGEFIIMPNHMHGIIILNNDDNVGTLRDGNNVRGNNVETGHVDTNVGTGDDGNVETGHGDTRVRTLHATSLHNDKMAKISPKSNSLSSIIRSYKSAVTKHANRLNLPFAWQARFHEHIIRDDESFQKISEYVINNPAKWELDRFYTLQ